MKSRMGENISAEWENEPLSPELWNALQLIENDALAGIQELERLSCRGSALSMMYLGHALMTGRHGLKQELNAGENWLKESIKRGSIEARYQLAKQLEANDRGREAVEQFEQLTELGYAPAMFLLGHKYYVGDSVDIDIKKAYHYFLMAKESGHLFGTRGVAEVLSKHCKRPFSRLRGMWIRVRHFFPFYNLLSNFPNSDRLRR